VGDVSWLKNHNPSTSIFAWNYDDDFFAGYDHGRQAGTMSIADHNVIPGKKFFTWGKGPGRTWDNTLTDNDGPYIELMVGAYSDNQPDYSWLEPYEGRSFSMNWYPFRSIGGVKRANLDAAVNLDVKDGVAKVGFCTTSARRAARVTVKAGARTLLEETVAIDPAKPYRKDVTVPAGIDPHDVVATLSDGGKELVSYSPIRLQPEPAPKPVTPPAAPSEIKSSEELYLIGLRARQFYDPSINPEPYWEEALRRDPLDSRVNTALGISRLKQARYDEAEKLFRRAIERITDRYTSPKDGEPLYYLGVTLKAQGKLDEAYTYFYKAAWNQGWKAAGYYGLAEIASLRGNMNAALDFANQSIDSNALNIRAQNLKAAMLRHLGRPKEAMDVLNSAAHRLDPLDVRSMAERWLASKSAADAKTLRTTMYQHPATAQEVAAEYLNAGLWKDGSSALLQMTENAVDPSKVNPLAYYYLAYFAGKLDQRDKAAAFRKQAKALSPEYVFPFQREAIDVLAQAAQADAADARARYYLGNLLFDWQPERAVKLWQESASIDPAFAMVHRNLATAYAHQKPAPDMKNAVAELERAVACERKYPLHFAELDELYEQAAVPVEKRYPLFEKNASIVAMRDDALNRSIALMVAMGKYDDAIRSMSGKKFALAEGANLNVSEHWTEAHLLRGRTRLSTGQFKLALQDFETAITIPSNLPASYSGGTRTNSEAAYWTGIAYEGLGDKLKAAEFWTKGAAAPPTGGGRRGGGMPPFGFMGSGAQTYYQAMCSLKLGQSDKAKGMFQELVSSGQRAMEQQPPSFGGRGRTVSPRARTAMAHYTIGLGYLGLNDVGKAKAEFAKSVELSPDLLGARTALANLK
jgi:tetratricopeptide (TPR) repeat protein